MIKLYEEYNQLPEIPEKIKDRIILDKFIPNGDGTFTYDASLPLNKLKLKKLPDLKITQVNGHFWCQENKLESLENCPPIINGSFNCSHNQLTSLKYCPSIKNTFFCDHNKLTSLKYCPSIINENMHIYNNKLISLVHAPKKVYYFWCNYNKLLSIEHNINNIFEFDAGENISGYYKQPFTEITEDHKEIISKMSSEELSDHLVFLGKHDQRAYKLLSDYLKEIGYDVLTDEDNPFSIF